MEMFDDAGTPLTGELPIVDYKHLPKREVEERVPLLAREELEVVLRYESAHRDRTPLIRLLMARLRHLRRGTGDQPPPGGYGPAPR